MVPGDNGVVTGSTFSVSEKTGVTVAEAGIWVVRLVVAVVAEEVVADWTLMRLTEADAVVIPSRFRIPLVAKASCILFRFWLTVKVYMPSG